MNKKELAKAVDDLSSPSRRKRQAAAHAIAESMLEKPQNILSFTDDIFDALERPEAQTRWELLNSLTMIVEGNTRALAPAVHFAEPSLFDEDSSTVRLASFRFITAVGAQTKALSKKVWPMLEESIQVYHGDPQYREMLMAITEFVAAPIDPDIKKAVVARIKFDAKNSTMPIIKHLANDVLKAARGQKVQQKSQQKDSQKGQQKKTAATKAAATKTTATKKAATKTVATKAAAKKAATKAAATKAAAKKKSAIKKPATKKPATKKGTSRSAAKKVAAKKTAASKKVSAATPAAKKVSAKKPASRAAVKKATSKTVAKRTASKAPAKKTVKKGATQKKTATPKKSSASQKSSSTKQGKASSKISASKATSKPKKPTAAKKQSATKKAKTRITGSKAAKALKKLASKKSR